MIVAFLSHIRALALFIIFFAASLLPQPTYIEGVVGQPTGFTTQSATNDIDRSINKIIYRSLFTYDSEGSIQNDLADYWERSDDGLVYTVRLGSDQHWQDGKLITANDVLYTVGSYQKLSGIATDRLDNRTVRFTLPNKFSPFLDLLTVPLLPEHKGDSNNPWLPVGSGTYRVVRITRDQGLVRSVVLEGNSLSLGIARVVFRFYESEDDLEMAAKLGEINGFYEKNGSFTYKGFTKYSKAESNRYYALFYNLRRDYLKELNVRAQLTSALPVSKMLKEALGDNFVLASGPLSLNKYSVGDLSYAGVSGKTVLPKELTLVVVDTDQNGTLAAFIKEAWGKLGVNVYVKAYEAEKVTNDVLPSRDFDVLLYGQEVSFDPDRYVLWHTTQDAFPGLNLSGLSNARSDKALEEGRKVNSFEDRYKHYAMFQSAVMAQIPAVFLYHPVFNYYLRSNLINIDLKNFSLPEDRFYSLSSWAFN